MYFEQLKHSETGCLSYIVGCLTTREMAIVDPNQKIDLYLDRAAKLKSNIIQVIDTHIHADHLSGGPGLARATGAPYRLHSSSQTSTAFTPMDQGDVIEVGNAKMQVLHTPGHSPESTCLLVSDHARGPEPAFLLTGDTLLIGDVGRPDLHVDPLSGARDLFKSLREKLFVLEDHLELFPSHYGGSSCGVGLSPRTSSTLGYERRIVPILGLDEERFVAELASRDVRPPEDHLLIIAANRGAA